MLQTECGYTPSEIGAMTLHDVQRLNNHWQRHPPLRVLVGSCAAALGVKLPEMTSGPKQYMTAEDAMALKRLTGGKIPGIGGM